MALDLLLENRDAQSHPLQPPLLDLVTKELSRAKAGFSLPFPLASYSSTASITFPQLTRAFPFLSSSLFMFSKDRLTFKAFSFSPHSIHILSATQMLKVHPPAAKKTVQLSQLGMEAGKLGLLRRNPSHL